MAQTAEDTVVGRTKEGKQSVTADAAAATTPTGDAAVAPELDTESGSDGKGNAEDSNEEGTLRFLWAPKRMDGKPIVMAPVVAGDVGNKVGTNDSSDDSNDGESDDESGTGNESGSGGGSGRSGDGSSVPLIMYALLHHRQAFTSANGLTDLGTPTLHGQVSSIWIRSDQIT